MPKQSKEEIKKFNDNLMDIAWRVWLELLMDEKEESKSETIMPKNNGG